MQTRPLATSPFLNFTSSLRHFVSFSPSHPFSYRLAQKVSHRGIWLELFTFKHCNCRYFENFLVPCVIFLNPQRPDN